MIVRQSIENPQGVSVFGSALIRVEPDIASVQFTITHTDMDPRKSFENTKQDNRRVRDYLLSAKIDDVQSSRITLSEATTYRNGELEFIGYRALMILQVILRDLDRLEDMLTGLVDAGVSSIGQVEFQTSRLKAVRAEARRMAVDAALEKAELYCSATGTRVGRVLYIEDINPDNLSGREGSQISHSDSGPTTVETGKIVVGGAVQIVYAIEE